MARKPPAEERKLILARDQRRKYGARLTFQVQRSAYIGDLENVTLLLQDGSIATIRPVRVMEWEGGKQYEIDVEGYPTATEAEVAGMQIAQALLLCAVSLNFGLRLSYNSHKPPTVFDRTISLGAQFWGEGYASWPQDVVLAEVLKAIRVPLRDRRLLLSMELFTSAALESNDRAKFVMAVSALEPLAEQVSLGSEVESAVDNLCSQFEAETSIPVDLRNSLRGRLLQLKRESIRQALKRLCTKWFPAEPTAWANIDRAYGLRSQLLHEGRPADLDVLLAEESGSIAKYLRRIYQSEYEYALRSAVAV